MTWLWHQAPSLVLVAWGVGTFFLVGNRRREGWALGFLGEGLWGAYAIATRQEGFLVGAAFYAVVYARNWVKWRPGDAEAAEAPSGDALEGPAAPDG